MTADGEASPAELAEGEEPIDRGVLYVELVALRRPGLRPGIAEKLDLPQLRAIANTVSPEETDSTKQLQATLQKASERLGGGDYTEAIADLWGVATTYNTKSTKRRAAAIERLGTTEETFNRHGQKKMTEALADELLNLFSVATDSTVTRANSVDIGASVQKSRALVGSKRRIVLAIGAVAGAICVAIAIGISNRSSVRESIPPSGSIINADSGEIEGDPVIRGVSAGGPQIAGGTIFRACNLSAKAPCTYPIHPHPISAHAGDIIEFRLRLYNPMAEPLPYAKFYASWGADTRHLRLLHIEMAIEWPYVHNAGVGRPPEVEEATLKLPVPTTSNDLVYKSGSTVLLNRNNHLVAHLPGGIMSNGIALSEIGSPPSCFECAVAYTRFITFRAQVG